jgi:hypothetical protein
MPQAVGIALAGADIGQAVGNPAAAEAVEKGFRLRCH